MIDTTAPTVSSISSPSVAGTGSGPVSWTVNFSEPVTGVDNTDIQVNNTGTVAVGSVGVTGSGSGPYTVTLSSITGIGTTGFTVKAGAGADAATNTNPASSASPTTGVGSTLSIANCGIWKVIRARPRSTSWSL